MPKIINYKAKISRSLSNIVRLDPEIIILKPNENAITSNLFRRVQRNKNHFIEMEYDKYEIKSNLISELMNPTRTSTKKYRPKPDIIAHYKKRDSNSIVLVAEAKKFYNNTQSIRNIVNDYYKIWGYKIATNIQQGILIIYPMNNTGNPIYKKAVDVHNEIELINTLNSWGRNELGAINIVFNQSELDRLISDKLGGKVSFKDNENNNFIIFDGGLTYLISFTVDNAGTLIKKVESVNNFTHTNDNTISHNSKTFTRMEDVDLVYETPNSELAKLIQEGEFALKNKEGVVFEHNVFFNNAMLKFYISNGGNSANPMDTRRNLLIISYTLEYGFVFGMRNINIDNVTSFLKVKLNFGYQPGETWTYFAIKNMDTNNEDDFIRDPAIIMDFLNGNHPTRLINLHNISSEIGLNMDWD